MLARRGLRHSSTSHRGWGIERAHARSAARPARSARRVAAGAVLAATPFIGHFQIRNRGTLGGSIAHADPAGEYPAVALALDASMEVVSADGRRTIPARDFFDGFWTTSMQPDELLAGVTFPIWSGRCGFAVEEFARRHGDFAIAGAAIGVELDADDRIRRCAIGLHRPRIDARAGRRRRGRGRRPADRRSRPRRARSARDGGPRVGPLRPERLRRVPNARRRGDGGARVDDARARRRSMPDVPVQRDRERPGARPRPSSPPDARRLPARGVPAHRHAPRMRARRVRRVHGAPRRRRRALVPRCSRCRPTAPRSRRSRESAHPTASCRRCRRRSATATACSAASARPGFVVSVTAFLRDNADPTDDEIRDRAVGHPLPLHRLPGHLAAVRQAADANAVAGSGEPR